MSGTHSKTCHWCRKKSEAAPEISRRCWGGFRANLPDDHHMRGACSEWKENHDQPPPLRTSDSFAVEGKANEAHVARLLLPGARADGFMKKNLPYKTTGTKPLAYVLCMHTNTCTHTRTPSCRCQGMFASEFLSILGHGLGHPCRHDAYYHGNLQAPHLRVAAGPADTKGRQVKEEKHGGTKQGAGARAQESCCHGENLGIGQGRTLPCLPHAHHVHVWAAGFGSGLGIILDLSTLFLYMSTYCMICRHIS